MKPCLIRLGAIIATSLLLAGSLQGQFSTPGSPPELLSYQGYLVDTNGNPLGTDGLGNPQPTNYDVLFRIYAQAGGDTALWTEQQTITVDAGYFSVLLGEGAIFGSDPRPNLSTIFCGLDGTERFVGISVRLAVGGEFTEILPRLRLLTSPYAFLSTSANQLVTPQGSALVTADGTNLTVTGSVSATGFSGSGASLTALNAGNMTTGTLHADRVPNLSATKVTTGVFHVDRIPNLNAAKINAGTLADARLSTNIPRLASAQTFSQQNIFTGGIRLSDSNLYLRGGTDASHGLGWHGAFGGMAVDGPVLFGNAGGVLGTNHGGTQKAALRWGGDRVVHIPNQLTVGTPEWSSTNFGMRVQNNFTDQIIRIDYERFLFFAPPEVQLSLHHFRRPRFEWLFGDEVVMRLPSSGNLMITGTLSQGSDRNRKENLHALDSAGVLAQVVDLPLYEWSFIGRPESIHIGPMAQDFYAAFNLGESETSLVPSDLAGVALAAIQGLHAVVREQEAEIADLRQSVAGLQAAVQALVEAQAAGQ